MCCDARSSGMYALYYMVQRVADVAACRTSSRFADVALVATPQLVRCMNFIKPTLNRMHCDCMHYDLCNTCNIEKNEGKKSKKKKVVSQLVGFMHFIVPTLNRMYYDRMHDDLCNTCNIDMRAWKTCNNNATVLNLLALLVQKYED